MSGEVVLKDTGTSKAGGAQEAFPLPTTAALFTQSLPFFLFFMCACVYTEDLLHCKCFQESNTSVYNPSDLYKSWPLAFQA